MANMSISNDAEITIMMGDQVIGTTQAIDASVSYVNDSEIHDMGSPYGREYSGTFTLSNVEQKPTRKHLGNGMYEYSSETLNSMFKSVRENTLKNKKNRDLLFLLNKESQNV